jgi:hypothetical protein
MASGPPDDDSVLPDGWSWGDVGHGALEIAGLVPGWGEGADVANAIWYANEAKYLEAGLSLISVVPIVGDAIGKGGKLASRLGGPALKKLVPLLKKMDFAKALAPFRKNKKLAPHIDKMVEALNKWRNELIAKSEGKAICPTTGKIIEADVVAAAKRTGIPPGKMQEIIDTPKASRPDPDTYMPKERIAKHLDQFDQGGSRFMLKGNLDKYGPAQRDGTSFILTKTEADKLLRETGGDPRKLEQALGLPTGQLDSDTLMRVDFPNPRDLGLRMPTGREAGANDKWLPGGTLPDGALEAVIDAGKLKPGDMIAKAVGRGP